ncbi:hypothetical protein [Spirosoma spitsbergense]|uniref:hypothetical protein n=1 Tax=Spirosoma spitsbergense TaxID=431554 RepID=UPI00036E09BC|nr:hypothetical protein [Spirosoma spitsbergense]
MVQLTKQLSGLLIVGTLCFAACKSSETVPTNSVSLGMNQSARLSSGVAVRVDSIQDSRCPVGVTCVWAGQAKVKMLLSKDSDSTMVSLILEPGVMAGSPKRLDSTNVSLSSETYKVILKDVNPYPTTTNQSLPKSAVVEVTKV